MTPLSKQISGLSPWTLLQAWGITLLGLIWALAWPLYRQLKHSSFAAGSSTTMLADEAVARRRLALGAMLLAGGAWLAYAQIETATQGFVVLGMILFAAAWVLPILLAWALRLLGSLLPQRYLY